MFMPRLTSNPNGVLIYGTTTGSSSTSEFEEISQQFGGLQRHLGIDETSLPDTRYEGSVAAGTDYGFAMRSSFWMQMMPIQSLRTLHLGPQRRWKSAMCHT